MGWIPGWNSIAEAEGWSSFYFWLSIICLIGLGVAEVASHRYGERKDELVAVQDAAKDEQHDQDMARVRQDTAQATEHAAQLEKDTAALNNQNLILQKQIIATEHALADRFIWYDQRPAFQAALSKYPGMTARLWMYPASSSDTFTLGMTITGLMMGAKWQAALWDLHTASPVPRVQVLYRKSVPNSKEAADALVAGLRNAKIEFVGDPIAMEANEPVTTPPAPSTVAISTSKEISVEEAIRVFIGGKANPFR